MTIVIVASVTAMLCAWLALRRRRREPWLLDRTARWSLNNGMSGEWSVGEMTEAEAWKYVTKRLFVEGKADRHGLDWLEIDFVEYWADS